MSARPFEQLLQRALQDYERHLRGTTMPPSEIAREVRGAANFVAFLLGQTPER